jgi:N-acetylneuraminate synthase/N,N'-diacetyllegionaminate synthase
MRKIRIGESFIGEGERYFIVSEVGVNHNADIELAKELIKRAKEAGADAVKFQTYKAEHLVSRKHAEKLYNVIKDLQLSYDDFLTLSALAKKEGITFLSTPFDEESVNFLDSLDVPAFKIASEEVTNHPFLRYIARKGKPIILSTGMSTLTEVAEAVDVLRGEGAEDIVLLHCVSNYPARVEDANLKAITTLKAAFHLPVGFSDHTEGISIPIAAVAFGACMIEKHFTLDKNLRGPDHKASLEPDELKSMIKAIKEVEAALGDGVKRCTKEEEETRIWARRSIVARVRIKKGERIEEEALTTKRPTIGILPKYMELLKGKKVYMDVEEDEVLLWEHIVE